MHENTKICLNQNRRYHSKCCIDIDLNKLTNKIWVKNQLILNQKNISTFSLIFPKLFRWNIIQLNALGTEIMFDDFKSCASFLTHTDFWRSRIINNDGSVVMLNKILEITPNIKNFEFSFYNDFSMINASTMKNICKLKNLQNLESFILIDIPEVVNVEDLSTFIKNHRNTKIEFHYIYRVSEAYKIQLEALIDSKN
uniref:Uncharacterized protein n=1 Tax=Panagrolaimus superbus TaxID=310955 RepID=A0A914Y237_9BILA